MTGWVAIGGRVLRAAIWLLVLVMGLTGSAALPGTANAQAPKPPATDAETIARLLQQLETDATALGDDEKQALNDTAAKRMRERVRSNDRQVAAYLRKQAADGQASLRPTLRLARVRAMVTHEDPLVLLEGIEPELRRLAEKREAQSSELMAEAAQVYLDAGLPWTARDLLSAVTVPSARSKTVEAALQRVFFILEDDSPRLPCKAQDPRRRGLCEKLRHLLAIPPVREGLFSRFTDHHVNGRHTYPDTAAKQRESNKKDADDEPDLELDILKIDQVPLLSFFAGGAGDQVRKVPAEPLEKMVAAGPVRAALDALSTRDTPDHRRLLVRALLEDRAWREKFGLLGPSAATKGPPAGSVEVIEVRQKREYQLVVIRALGDLIDKLVLGLVRLEGHPETVHTFVDAGSLTQHSGRSLGAGYEDAIVLSSVGGSGHFLSVTIVDPRTARILTLGEKDTDNNEPLPYFQGTAHVVDLDYDGRAEVIITSGSSEGRFSRCNQCPRRRHALIWRLAPDLSEATVVGEHVTWGDLSFATGGLAGLGREAGITASDARLAKSFQTIASTATSGNKLEAEIKQIRAAIGSYEAAEDRGSAISAFLRLATVLGRRPDANMLVALRQAALVDAARVTAEDGRLSEAEALMSRLPAASTSERLPTALDAQKDEVRFDIARHRGRTGEQFASLSRIEAAGTLSLENKYRKLLYLAAVGDAAGSAETALAYARESGFWGSPGSYEITFQRAIALSRLGKADRALDILLMLARYAADSWSSTAFSRLYLLAGDMAIAHGEHAIARHLIDAAVSHMPSEFWRTDGPLVLSMYAKILIEQKQFDAAEAALAAAVRGAKSYRGIRLATPYDLLARMQEMRGAGAPAIQSSHSSLKALVEGQSEIAVEPHKLSFVESADSLAAAQIERLIRLAAPPADLLLAIEEWRAQVLRSQMRGPGAGDIAGIERSLPNVLARLAPNEALVSYQFRKAGAIALIATRTGVRQVPVPRAGEVGAMRDRVLELLDADGKGAEKTIGKDIVPDELRRDLQALTRILIEPLALDDEQNILTIIPDEQLYWLPWGALVLPDSVLSSVRIAPVAAPRLHPISEKYAIRILPSALILRPREKLNLGNAVLVGSTLGVPGEAVKRFLPSYGRSGYGPELSALTFTRREVGEIAKSLQAKNVRVARTAVIASAADVAALPGLVRGLFPKAGVIHIAGHGIFDTLDGMASAMLLGGADPRGVLRAVDFGALDLKSVGLVVLSGCETGKVTVRKGQEAFGFVRGLLVSGVKRAIVTQWVVNDQATALWFERLYSRLADGQVIEQAHRETIVEMAAKYRHPFYWGGITLYAR